jgi:hypothetical protein
VNQGTQQQIRKGSKVLCFVRVRLRRVCSLRGDVGKRSPLEDWHLHSRHPPDPLAYPHRYQIYSGFICKGAPEPRDAPSQFIPFHPFLSGGIYCRAAARVACKISPMSTMCRQRRRPMPAETLAVDKEILKAWRTPEGFLFCKDFLRCASARIPP